MTYSTLPQNYKVILWIVIAIVVVLIIYYVYRQFQAPANAAYVPGAPVPIGWSPTAVTDELANAVIGIAFSATKEQAYKDFNALNDNQMIDVYNDWNTRYAKTTSYFQTVGTLTNAVKGEWSDCIVSVGACQQDIILANLNRLMLP